VQQEAESGLNFAQKARFGLVADIITTQLQLVRNLRGLTSKFGCFNEEGFDEARFESHLGGNPVLAIAEFWYWTRKLQGRFLAADYAFAVYASSRAQQLLWTSPSEFETAEFCFYGALSHAASWDSASPDQKQKHFEALNAHHRQLGIWAENCPENFENRALLVGAEITRIDGRDLEAMRLYEHAIRSAHINGFVHNEAVAYEVAARFYAARGFDKIAAAYLREARYCYARWGADGKVRQLDQLYPHIKEEQPAPGPSSTIVAPTELLDLATVVKVSQAASGEIVLEKLIDKLMRAAVEHAGAERGLLILPRDVELRIEAEATTSGDNVIVHLRDASTAGAELPESLVRYVMRTQENVILEDALSGNSFSGDPYIVQHRARSILCMPLINQAKLTGVLYLENNLTPRVFTPDRITVLKVLASQAAVSLENTRLYRDLENRETKIRRLVEANVVGIAMWNLEGAITGANEAFLHMVQYDREDLASGRVRWTDLTPAEWSDRDERAIAELRASGVFQPYEKEYFRKDGSRVPILLGGALSEDSGNDGVAFILDLNDQKRAEEALRRSENYLAEAQGLSHTGSFGWNVSSGGIYWSEETYNIFEYDRAVKPTLELVLQRIHPDDRGLVQQALDRASEARADFDYEHRLLMPDGSIKHVHVSFRASDTSSGNLEYMGAVTDVTAAKQAEEKIRQTERELRQILDITPQLVSVRGPDLSRLYINQVALDYYGISLEEWRNSDENAVFYPGDWERIAAAVQQKFSSGVPHESEGRLRRSDGKYRWFFSALIRCEMIKDASFVGISRRPISRIASKLSNGSRTRTLRYAKK
jgi:PAS domain S-box-containing protein